MIPGPIDEIYHMMKIDDRLKSAEKERIANRMIREKRKAERAKIIQHKEQRQKQKWSLIPLVALFNSLFKSSHV